MVAEWLSSIVSTFALIALAEVGDKTQIVCMTLAARHRGTPILLGASLAFALLNVIAVLFGASLAQWIPEQVLAFAVAGLFALFGIQALRAADESDDEVTEPSGRGLFLSAFLLIFLAELGDKTQLAVAGLATAVPPVPVWIGGTLALIFISAVAVVAGRTVLQRLPMMWLQRAAGALFLLFALVAALRGFGVI
jgi:putative Ca2+/H+ antiporter (TMEM165/GDT1 family)